MRVNKSDFTSKRPVLNWDDLEEQVAVLTVSAADVVKVDDAAQESGTRTSICLQFEGTEKVMWPSPGDTSIIIDQFGDDTDEWVGKELPVEKVTRTFKGTAHRKVGVVAADEWDTYITPPKKAKAPVKSTAKLGVVKGGKKR